MLFRLFLMNRLRLLFSDVRFLAVMIAVPLFLSAMTGNALERQQKSDMPVLAVDLDGSEDSRSLLRALKNKEGLSVAIAQRDKAMRLLEDNQVEAVLTIPTGYGERLQSGNTAGLLRLDTAASADSQGFLTELIAGEVFRLSGDAFAWGTVSDILAREGLPKPADGRATLNGEYARLSGENWLHVEYALVQAKPPADGGIVNYPAPIAASLGLLVLFLLFGTLFGAGWLVEDRRNGTLARLRSARGASVSWFLGNWSALFLTGLFLAVILVGGSFLLTGRVPVAGMPSWLLIVVYLACLSSLGLAMSTVFPTADRLQAATPVIAIVSGFAGGCLWNQIGMIGNLPLVALATPQGWVLQALGGLYADPSDLGWLRSVAVLAASSILLAAFAWIRMQKEKGSSGR